MPCLAVCAVRGLCKAPLLVLAAWRVAGAAAAGYSRLSVWGQPGALGALRLYRTEVGRWEHPSSGPLLAYELQ